MPKNDGTQSIGNWRRNARIVAGYLIIPSWSGMPMIFCPIRLDKSFRYPRRNPEKSSQDTSRDSREWMATREDQWRLRDRWQVGTDWWGLHRVKTPCTILAKGLLWKPTIPQSSRIEGRWETHYVWWNGNNIWREKGRYLTQSYYKSPYTNKNVKRAKWQHKQRHKKVRLHSGCGPT